MEFSLFIKEKRLEQSAAIKLQSALERAQTRTRQLAKRESINFLWRRRKLAAFRINLDRVLDWRKLTVAERGSRSKEKRLYLLTLVEFLVCNDFV